MLLVISGNTPAQKNRKQIYRNRYTGKSFIGTIARVKGWQQDALWELKEVKAPAWSYPVKVEIDFYFNDRRNRDLDNCLSSVLDVLKKAEIITDDGYAYLSPITIAFGGIDKANPRAEISIS